MVTFAMFTVIELIALAFISILMIGSIWVDDRDNAAAVKWFVLVFGAVVAGVYWWNEWTVASVFSYIFSADFLQLLLIYILFGGVYASIKFLLKTRLAAVSAAATWKDWLKSTYVFKNGEASATFTMLELKKLFADGSEINVELSQTYTKEQYRKLESAYSSSEYDILRKLSSISPFFSFEIKKELDNPKVITLKAKVLDYVSAWCTFWPLYLIVNIFGDLIEMVFTAISNFIVHISSNLVGRIFRSSFNEDR
jgi:hypothetical protein